MRRLLETRAGQIIEHTGPTLPDADDFRQKYPNLWQLLQPQRFRGEKDEYDRMAAPYSVEMVPGGWRITFRDGPLAFSISAFSEKHADLIGALEMNAADPSTWVHYKARGRKLRKVPK